VQFEEVVCSNCGATVEWDGTYGKTVTCTYCGSTFLPAATALEDVWVMTDPVARARYEFEGNLRGLEHDIRYEVMRGQGWSDRDRAYVAEVQKLEREGIVRKAASFWAVSPHPPIYVAMQDGELRLGESLCTFHRDEEIVWACPMTRDRFGLNSPVLIGDLQDETTQRLCGEMVNAMQGRMPSST
jgi:hypothetical protein